MFEIHKRHTPMFVTSEIKQIAKLITEAFEFDALSLGQIGIEMVPIFQTVRINENNQFIVRSKLGSKGVMQLIENDPYLEKIRASLADPATLLIGFVKKLVDQLGVDSYLYIGEQKSKHELENTSLQKVESLLDKATKYSKKPLVIFSSSNDFQCKFEEQKWYDLDHPTIWLKNSLGTNMADTEAFFSVSPTLKLEFELNRYQTLESFGAFALGMVRF